MDQGPLVTEMIDAGAALIGAFEQYAPLRAAFWAKDSNEGVWFLYLASDRIDDANRGQAYGEVHRVFPKGPYIWLHPLQVKLVSTNSPVARAVIEYMRHSPPGQPARYWGSPLGGLSVEEAYIYPIPIPVPAPV